MGFDFAFMESRITRLGIRSDEGLICGVVDLTMTVDRRYFGEPKERFRMTVSVSEVDNAIHHSADEGERIFRRLKARVGGRQAPDSASAFSGTGSVH